VITTPSITPKYSAAKNPGLESKAIVGITGYGVMKEPMTLRAVKIDIRATRSALVFGSKFWLLFTVFISM
jgi:hypothetical protein